VTLTNPVNDTCSIDYLDEDSLVLSSDGITRSYYRKNDVNDLNKKAKAIATMRNKQALKEATE
jgi:serine phosphatase RsbU (regulator of sigma subunit)